MKCVTHILCRTCDHSFICNITSGSSLNKTDLFTTCLCCSYRRVTVKSWRRSIT